MKDIMRKVQEQGRMSSMEYKKLFQKVDLTKDSRERLEQAQRDLRGHNDRRSREVYRKLENIKEKIVPLEQIRVNPEEARKLSERTETRLRNEIKKGTIPKYDLNQDRQMQRWLKK